jgi:hypothetical protein
VNSEDKADNFLKKGFLFLQICVRIYIIKSIMGEYLHLSHQSHQIQKRRDRREKAIQDSAFENCRGFQA